MKPIEPAVIAEKLSALAESFPSLRGVPGVRPFDPATLAAHITDDDPHDRSIAAEFILWLCPRAYESDHAWSLAESFDLLEAVTLMGPEHRAALAGWLRDPWVPPLRIVEHHECVIDGFDAALREELAQLAVPTAPGGRA